MDHGTLSIGVPAKNPTCARLLFPTCARLLAVLMVVVCGGRVQSFGGKRARVFLFLAGRGKEMPSFSTDSYANII